jgi:PKD repeat protein
MKFNIIILVVILGILAALIIPINASTDPLEITTWNNNKTNDNSTLIKINISEAINFNATANQTIDTWNWSKDGSYPDNNFDNFSTSWDTAGIKTVSVNATNNNGTSETITWEIMVDPPEIISWSNNITNDQNDTVSIFTDHPITFNATADQSITTWNWYIEGIYREDLKNNDTFTTSWPDVGIRTVEVNATNDNGTSNTVNWTVTIKAPTGRPPNKGRDKDETDFDLGDMFGDLFVIRRDDNGVPILNETTGCIIPINKSDGSNITMDYDDETDSCELPAGAEEWVTEVHFGRLAIARSPEGVLESSYDEAITAINSALEIKLEASGRFLLLLPGIEDGDEPYYKAIDSSLENLALYKKVVTDSHLEGNLGPDEFIDQGDPLAPPIKRPTLDVEHFLEAIAAGIAAGGDPLNLDHLLGEGEEEIENEDFLSAASFLAAAADKTGHIDLDLVVNLNTIMGLNADLNGNGALEYEEYVNYEGMSYDRGLLYSKDITVLQPADNGDISGGLDYNDFWKETLVTIYDDNEDPQANEDIFTKDGEEPFEPDSGWIAGFVQAADDSLRVIYFVHKFQIPDLR